MKKHHHLLAILIGLCIIPSSGLDASEKKPVMMNQTIPVSHVSYSTNTSFEAFISKFESQLGHHDLSSYQNLLKDPTQAKEVEKTIHAQEGSSGFMIFAIYDHGALLAFKGTPQKARQYVIGNPLFAARMTEHKIGAALYAPLRVLVYADAAGNATIEYDQPSSLFGQFKDEKVTQVARELDRKLAGLIEKSQ
jgi:uncharacterized protein (DUF302 family)